MSFQDASQLLDITPVTDGIVVTMPNGARVTSTATATLNLPSLPAAARVVHLFPDLVGSLLSIGTLCDHGLTATYDKTTVTIRNDTSVVLRGKRSADTRLWMVDLCPLRQPSASSAAAVHAPIVALSANAATSQTQSQIVAWYHATMGFPAVPTFLAALDSGHVSLPGLTSAMVRKYPPTPTATAKGHLDQLRQGLRSTKQQAVPLVDLYETEEDWHPPLVTDTPPAPNDDSHGPLRTLNVQTRVVVGPSSTLRRDSDMAGRFPVVSKRGNQYQLVMYCNDSNYIHVEPLHCREKTDYVKAYISGDEFFRSRGIIPLYERLDNETSKPLERYCVKKNITIQYLPPGNHRASKAERAIRTWKSHFISILAGTDPTFPLMAWDELLEQAELTLNLMRTSRLSPNISAWQHVNGKFDFDRTPIAPLGMRIVSHVKTDDRASWAYHGIDGFYVGPALTHYRAFRVIAKDTMASRITDTLSWHPTDLLHLPGASPYDDMVAQIAHLQACLTRISTSPHVLAHQRAPLQAAIPPVASALQVLSDVFADRSDGIPPQPSDDTIGQPVAPISESAVISQPVSHDPVTPLSTTIETDAIVPAPTTVAPAAMPSSARSGGARPKPAARVQRVAFSIPSAEPPIRSDRPKRTTQLPSWLRANAVMERHVPDPTTRTAVVAKYKPLAFSQHLAPVAPLNYANAKKGPNSLRWERAEGEEFIRLIDETGTMRFIRACDLPADRVCSYYNPQLSIKFKNDVETYRVRGTYGGNISDFEGDKTAWTADMVAIKLLLNAAVSEDADFICADIKDFYLNTKLDRPEYMRISKRQIPLDIQKRYNLDTMWSGDGVYVEIVKGIYGLPQAGKLAQDRLVKHLATHGYHPAKNTPCLFKHESLPIVFTLVVDDFGIKVKGMHHAEHLFAALRELYTITVDYKGKKYVGITIDFDRTAKTVALSMPGYVEKALARFGVTPKSYATDSPSLYTPPSYGAKVQQLTTVDSTVRLSDADTKFVQQVVGVFAYYARAVDPTMLTAVNKIGSRQAEPTAAVMVEVNRLLQYAATWPNSEVVYHASDMIYVVHTDASYLSETKARSRAGGLHYLTHHLTPRSGKTTVNGAIECISTIIPSVVASAFEAEYAAMYINATTAEGIRNTLADLGYPQTATDITSDNSCAVGVANRTVTQRRSKAIDMRYHWIRDRVDQGHFTVRWKPGKDNLADYFTKSHPVHHYKEMRRYYVHTPKQNHVNQRARIHKQAIAKSP